MGGSRDLAGSHRALGRSTCRRRPDQRQLDRCLRAPVRIDGSDRELFQALSSRRCGSGQAAKYGWRTVLSIKRSARPSHCPASSARPGSATSEWLMAESQTPFQSRYVGLWALTSFHRRRRPVYPILRDGFWAIEAALPLGAAQRTNEERRRRSRWNKKLGTLKKVASLPRCR